MLTPRRLGVWGDPIEHSRSPQLHQAAYRRLGLDWTYDRRRVAAGGFGAAVSELGPEWLGLSLTMPLKEVAFSRAASVDRHAQLTGAVNTYLLRPEGAQGFNTDVGGLANALRELGLGAIDSARIVGAGATATSALVALGELGVPRVEVSARRPEAVSRLVRLGEVLDIRVTASALDPAPRREVPLTVATLPSDADLDPETTAALCSAGGELFDVVYGRWPTALGTAWIRAGRPARDGLPMLLHQALLQVRVFVGGDPTVAVPAEDEVLSDMRAAIVGG